MATKSLPTPSVTLPQLPSMSGIIDPALFSQVHDLILKHGKEDGDAFVLETGRLSIFIDPKPVRGEALLLVCDNATLISRVYGCQGLQEDMSACVAECLYGNTFAFLDCRVPEEFMDEMLEEIKCECSFLPDDEKREIVFKVRDEIGPEKIREMFLRALEAGKRRVA